MLCDGITPRRDRGCCMEKRPAISVEGVPVLRAAVEMSRWPAFGALAPGVLAFLSAWVFFLGGAYDTDGWFILASGREVVEGGIPRENPWADVSGLGVVVQQWLHDLWAWAWYRALGFGGLDAMAAAEACAVVALAWHCLPAFGEGARPGAAAVSLGCAAAVFAIGPYRGVRPTAWTMLAVLAACGICRKARGDSRLYALLPALTALHANLHAAMWPLPAFAAACFLLPDRWGAGWLRDGRLRAEWARSRAPLAAAVAGMAAASLLNPYGLQGSLYGLAGAGEAAYGGYIREMRPLFETDEAAGLAAIVAAYVLAAALACARGRRLPPPAASALLAASAVAALMSVRSMWIFQLACVMAALSACGDGPSAPARREWAAPLLVCAAVVAGMAMGAAEGGLHNAQGGACGVGSASVASWEEGERGFGPLASRIASEGGGRVFCSSDSGMAVLEFYGAKVPFDLRPEMWAPPITGADGYYPWRDYADAFASEDALARYADEYGFEWAVVPSDDSEGWGELLGMEACETAGGWSLLRLGAGPR